MNQRKLECVTADTFKSSISPSVIKPQLSLPSSLTLLIKHMGITLVIYVRYNICSGERLSNSLALFPIVYLSAGTCATLIIIGGSTSKTFFQIVCGAECAKQLTTVEWYLVFTCAAVVLSQLPNLNSIAGVSLVGAITAVGYCTMIWGVSVAEGRLPGVSYNPVKAGTQIEQVFSVLNALGIIAFAFRGHNLILEIQVIFV